MVVARVLSSQLPGHVDEPITLEGWVHRVRDLGGVRFLVLRDRAGLAQVVIPPDLDLNPDNSGGECVVRIRGTVHREERARAAWR